MSDFILLFVDDTNIKNAVRLDCFLIVLGEKMFSFHSVYVSLSEVLVRVFLI